MTKIVAKTRGKSTLVGHVLVHIFGSGVSFLMIFVQEWAGWETFIATWEKIHGEQTVIMRPFSEVPLISTLYIFYPFCFYLFYSSFAMQDSSMTPSWSMFASSLEEMMSC